MRAMALMYLGTSPLSHINVNKDYYLSPLEAPEKLLAQFPRTFLICGEKDPFIDDTVLFAERLREAKERARIEWERERGRRDRERMRERIRKIEKKKRQKRLKIIEDGGRNVEEKVGLGITGYIHEQEEDAEDDEGGIYVEGKKKGVNGPISLSKQGN